VDAYTRGIVSQRLIRNLRDNIAVMEDAQLIARGDLPTSTASSPHFSKTRKTSCSRPFCATSNMRSCDSLSMSSYRSHASFALGHAVEFNLNAHTANARPSRRLSR